MADVLIITGTTGFLGNLVLNLAREQLGKKFETVVSVDRFGSCNLSQRRNARPCLSVN